MKFIKNSFCLASGLIFLSVIFGLFNLAWAQKNDESISTVVLDSAPKKLYSELYLDESGNQFLVEIYEEPQEGENLIHFRTFKNGEIIGRKSQALSDSHNFTFFIDETEQRIMRKDTEQMLYNVLKKLMEESDQKLKSKLEDLFDQEKMAKSLSEKIKTPERQIKNMAQKISEQIKDDENISDMAKRISKEIKTPEEQISAMASRISQEIKTPDEQISSMAVQISQQIKTPEARVNEDNLALNLAIKLTQDENLVATKVPPYQELLSQVSASNEQQDYEKTIKILDEDIADRTPEEQRKALKISGLMSVLVASKKLKRAISTIDDYDLPDDPSLREISSALSEWLSKNLVSE